MSRIVRFHRTGGPEVLQFDELDIGPPKAGEVRIRVRALGLNRAEAMFRSGRTSRPRSCLPGSAGKRPAKSRPSARTSQGFRWVMR